MTQAEALAAIRLNDVVTAVRLARARSEMQAQARRAARDAVIGRVAPTENRAHRRREAALRRDARVRGRAR